MHHLAQRLARSGVAMALTASALTAHATLLDNHVKARALYQGGVDLPQGYDEAYSIQLGTGSWEYPYVDLYVDRAEGKSSYANILAGPSYLTYIQEVDVVQVKAGDEISARTLADSILPTVFRTYRTAPFYQLQPLNSPSGDDPDIYLGFSYTGINPPSTPYGWVHLRYTQAAGLSVVSSAMTTSDAGIFALTRNTISVVPESSTAMMLGMGLLGILGLAHSRRGQRTA